MFQKELENKNLLCVSKRPSQKPGNLMIERRHLTMPVVFRKSIELQKKETHYHSELTFN